MFLGALYSQTNQALTGVVDYVCTDVRLKQKKKGKKENGPPLLNISGLLKKKPCGFEDEERFGELHSKINAHKHVLALEVIQIILKVV